LCGVGGAINFERGTVVHKGGIHEAQLENMQHVIITALARFMEREEVKQRLVSIQGRRCQFFSTLELDPDCIENLIDALNDAAHSHRMPFALTPKFKVAASTYATHAGYLPGIFFSVNFAGSIPYFFQRTNPVNLN
jgi:hypothetical protein